jgi:flagellar biosynthesis protein FliQ
MIPEVLISLTKEAIFITIVASMPAILASLVIGLVVAIFSATTQIQEQTLSFAPKMIAVYLALIACGAPLCSLVVGYGKSCFLEIIKLSP